MPRSASGKAGTPRGLSRARTTPDAEYCSTTSTRRMMASSPAFIRVLDRRPWPASWSVTARAASSSKRVGNFVRMSSLKARRGTTISPADRRASTCSRIRWNSSGRVVRSNDQSMAPAIASRRASTPRPVIALVS